MSPDTENNPQFNKNPSVVLLTGATGYIGGRLLKVLENRGLRVRCLTRNPEFLQQKVSSGTEVVKGDVLDADSLKEAFRGVDAAYYMVHSMGSSGSFEVSDRIAAENFGKRAFEAGVKRIIYLGGLGDENITLSPHLRSRHEVGQILRQSGVQVIEFRASIVIGAGSLSFEMIRALVERLPVMITPKWVSVSAQPIAISDILSYLTEGLFLDDSQSKVYEIGGRDQVSYGDIMKVYARCRHIRIWMIPVPFLTPYLSSLWLGFVTPLYARVGRKLIESIEHPTVVNDTSALTAFDIQPLGIEQAVQQALTREDEQYASTRWSDSLSSGGEVTTWAGVKFGTRLVESRVVDVSCPPETVFRTIERIGGDTGWYAWNRLWKIRGFLDLLVGGIGMRRGRPDPERLRVGDTLDCWRVEAIEPGRRLRLISEMKLPGRAWLEFEVSESDRGSSLRQTVIFDPAGLFGQLYWYSLYVFHKVVFKGMLHAVAKAAENSDG